MRHYSFRLTRRYFSISCTDTTKAGRRTWYPFRIRWWPQRQNMMVAGGMGRSYKFAPAGYSWRGMGVRVRRQP